MARWVEHVANWLQPITESIKGNLFKDCEEGGYVQVDESPIKYLSPGTGKAQQGYVWTYRKPATQRDPKGGDVYFDWQTSRGHECLKKVIPSDYRGVVQCDAYSAYPTFARSHANEIILAGCWAHVRRKFFEAYEIAGEGSQAQQRGAWILRQIQNLYRIEKKLRESRAGPAGPALRQAVRQGESRPILARIRRYLETIEKSKSRVLSKSHLGKAIAYTLSQWDALNVFINDGRVEIDNNLVENAIRPTALGKKNWLFIGGADTGWRSAVIYTIIESCRTRGCDPWEYLQDVLTRLPNATNWDIPSLTPAAWIAEREKLKMSGRAS